MRGKLARPVLRGRDGSNAVLLPDCRYLDQLHPGHGVTGATGTPVSNSMVELYT